MNILIIFLKTIILGIVQGITEWLPISSTGHMILINDLMPLVVYKDVAMNKDFMDMFMVVIQFGSILAVLLLYFKRLNPFKRNKNKKIVVKKDTINLWKKVIVGIIPAGIIGVLFDDIIDTYLYNSLTVAIMLIVYGILFILIENRNKNKEPKLKTIKEMSYKDAFKVGCFQVLALIPGTSRSGSTILGGMILGLKRSLAAEFSFFMAIPVMFGASALKLIKLSMHLDGLGLSVLLVGVVVAFAVSIIAIKGFIKYINSHDFKAFGYYRIVLGIIILLLMLF